MINKLRVHGKTQNSTALGIVNAYLEINPQATLAELQQAFPDSLNPDSGVKSNFVDLAQVSSEQSEKGKGYFTANGEILNLADGTKVAMVNTWTSGSLLRLVNRAADFGIEIADFTEADKCMCRKGGYRFEYLNGFVPPVVEELEKVMLADEPKKPSKILPIVVFLLLLALIVAALLV